MSFQIGRTQWETPPLAAQARALHRVLERFGKYPESLQAAGYAGVVTVKGTKRLLDSFCHLIVDRIEHEGVLTEVQDIACWGDGWMYARKDGFILVLAAAFEESDRVYTIKRGGSLADVARVTGTLLSDLEQLNPAMPKRLDPGTQVLLP